VVAISTDSHFSHAAWRRIKRADGGIGDLKIEMVADYDKEVSESYGVLMDGGMAARGMFVVDGKGVLRSFVVNDLMVGRSVGECLRVVEAFQYADEFGEVCPADWKKGGEGIVPDVEGSKKYFNKL